MSKCFAIVCAMLFMFGFGAGSSVLAKPPDLPIDLGATVEEPEISGGITLGFDFFTGKFTLSISLPWQFLQNWLSDDLTMPAPTPVEAKVPPDGAGPERETSTVQGEEVLTLQQNQARHLFEIAERCLKNGDLDKARTCYEETHLLAPETPCGRQAIQRLAEIDNARIGNE